MPFRESCSYMDRGWEQAEKDAAHLKGVLSIKEQELQAAKAAMESLQKEVALVREAKANLEASIRHP